MPVLVASSFHLIHQRLLRKEWYLCCPRSASKLFGNDVIGMWKWLSGVDAFWWPLANRVRSPEVPFEDVTSDLLEPRFRPTCERSGIIRRSDHRQEIPFCLVRVRPPG